MAEKYGKTRRIQHFGFGVGIAGAAAMIGLSTAAAANADGLDTIGAASGVADAAATNGPTVADLDTYLEEIGLGTLVANNDLFLQTDATLSIPLWFFETSAAELLNAVSGVDASTLTAVLFLDFSPAAQDVGDILKGTGDLSTNLSQLGPDFVQGYDEYVHAAIGLFLGA